MSMREADPNSPKPDISPSKPQNQKSFVDKLSDDYFTIEFLDGTIERFDSKILKGWYCSNGVLRLQFGKKTALIPLNQIKMFTCDYDKGDATE